MSTPTPGPWHWVRYEGGTYDCLETDDGTDVIRRVLDDAGQVEIDVPNSANANLIASAPALLAAAEAAVPMLLAVAASGDRMVARAARLTANTLAAAIAQARGETD